MGGVSLQCAIICVCTSMMVEFFVVVVDFLFWISAISSGYVLGGNVGGGECSSC